MLRAHHLAAAAAAALLSSSALVAPALAQEQLPDGKTITPVAIPYATQQFLNPGLANYPNFVAGQALLEALSPDGTTLAIICAGQNSLNDSSGAVDTANSTQYIFLYDVSGAHKAQPRLKQVIQQPNAYAGLVFSPDGSTLYATGGADDAVYVYTQTNGTWSLSGKIALNHKNVGLGGFVEPNAGGLAISADGRTLVVANNYNDSISVIDTASQSVRYEHDLRPWFINNEGKNGVPGGEYPFAVVLKGGIAYVSAARDREVDVIDISSPLNGKLVTRIAVNGNALGMALSRDGSTLYVAQDNADQVAVIDTASNTVVGSIDTRGPAALIGTMPQRGAAPISVRLTPNGRFLYAVNAGANSIAVIDLKANRVIGLLPTAYEPTDVAFSADGSELYIVNGKSNTGPNPANLTGATPYLTTYTYPGGNVAAAAMARASNQYQFQLERASLVTAPVPTSLTALTALVAQNNGYRSREAASDAQVMNFLRNHIQHVIYVVKENRTFDQVLGDLTNGAMADPNLAIFGAAITPNYHAIATQFVTLDDVTDIGDGSMDGWSWSMQGRITDTQGLTQQINYAFVNRGLSYESEGSNRNVPVGLASAKARDHATGGLFTQIGNTLPGGAVNLLPGIANHTAADSPVGKQQGYIFNVALAALKTVRNYGWMVSNIGPITDQNGNPIIDPRKAHAVQVAELNPYLVGMTDRYFRGFDQAYPDLWRYNEWKHEFDQYVAGGDLPNLSLVRFSHDHMGKFSTALAGVNTPETMQADNDLSVALLIQAVANSPYAKNTLIFIIEDDAQDGPDHIDSHRTTAYVVGPYVKKGAVVHTHYSQINVLRTIEDVLGTQHLNLNTATQRPMADVFDTSAANANWSFTATASTVLQGTGLFPTQTGMRDLGIRYAAGPRVRPAHDAAYWAAHTAGFDFSKEDRVPDDLYNRVLWAGLKGTAYPASGADRD